MARPSKLTYELKLQLLALVRASVPPAIAASSLGICTKTLKNWMDRAATETEGDYFELGQDVEQARAQAKLPYISAIAKSARNNTKDAKWMLERLDPEHFERRRMPPSEPERVSAAEYALEICQLIEAANATVPAAPPSASEPGSGSLPVESGPE